MFVFDNAQFRTDFPEFADLVKYPDSLLTFWGVVAVNQVRQCVWNNMYVQGLELYVAHEVTLAAQNSAAAMVGGTPGLQGGVPSSKAVDRASISFDATSTSEKDAGWWNLTTYGKQFIRLARLFGAGAIQL